MSEFRVGTFYTRDTVYKQIFESHLKISLEKFEIPYSKCVVDNHDNWFRNVAEKPKVILELLNRYKTNLVFLDVDATIEEYPNLFEEIPDKYEIAFHTLDWNLWYGYKNTPPVKELLTGTMFFKPTKKVKRLCKEWYDLAIKTREWEQKILQRLIKNYDLNIYKLPLSYCYMKTRPRGQEPLVKIDPVIIHYQVSRELKGKII